MLEHKWVKRCIHIALMSMVVGGFEVGGYVLNDYMPVRIPVPVVYADSNNQIVTPNGPWEKGVEDIEMSGVETGRKNIAGSVIDTENQKMSGTVNISVYKLSSNNPNFDFYSIMGIMDHGVTHKNKSYNPKSNWLSVGYYATDMQIELELATANGSIWDFGPTSSVGSSTTGFTLGGDLKGSYDSNGGGISGGFSGSFGAQFSSSDVSIVTAKEGDTKLFWTIKLPGVGFKSPGNPANPKESSYAGYKWYFGVIYKVPKGSQFQLKVTPAIHWKFDYTRGNTKSTRDWSPATVTYTYKG
jgi:hypothetical protein